MPEIWWLWNFRLCGQKPKGQQLLQVPCLLLLSLPKHLDESVIEDLTAAVFCFKMCNGACWLQNPVKPNRAAPANLKPLRGITSVARETRWRPRETTSYLWKTTPKMHTFDGFLHFLAIFISSQVAIELVNGQLQLEKQRWNTPREKTKTFQPKFEPKLWFESSIYSLNWSSSLELALNNHQVVVIPPHQIHLNSMVPQLKKHPKKTSWAFRATQSPGTKPRQRPARPS